MGNFILSELVTYSWSIPRYDKRFFFIGVTICYFNLLIVSSINYLKINFVNVIHAVYQDID